MLDPAARLRASAITPSLAKRLQIRILSASQVRRLAPHFREAPALLLLYRGAPPFFRVRYLDTDTSTIGQRKYDQPANRAPRAYLPGLLPWDRIEKDVAVPLVITEGELKAACACIHEIATLGLGGVWNWKSRALGNSFLPELERFDWENRSVLLCFDSDITTNHQVQRALLGLARSLAERGARCERVTLPSPDGEKVGLDDFLVAQGRAAFMKLPREPIQQDEGLRRSLFDRFVQIVEPNHVYDLEEDCAYKGRQHFVDQCSKLKIPDAEGDLVSLPGPWYKDSGHLTVSRYGLRPHTLERVVDGVLNTFRGLAVEPRRGSVAPALRVLDAVVGPRPEIQKWLLQWLAYPLQHPGAKLHQGVFVCHNEQGVGKSALGYLMLDIYGKDRHATTLSDNAFFGSWNSYLERTLFALCDDLSFDPTKKCRNAFVNAITSETVQLSAKYRDAVSIENRCNFYFTANSVGALPLDTGNDNRRVLVLHVQKLLPDRKRWFRDVFDPWRKNGGAAHWLYYLLRVDLAGFHPYEDAPRTEEKKLAVDSSAPALHAWAEDALGRYFDQSDLWTTQQIYETARKHNPGVALPAVVRALMSTPAVPLGQWAVGGGRRESFWAVRNGAEWKRKSKRTVVETWKAQFAITAALG